MRRLAQATAYTVMLKLFLSSDHVSAATGKTVAIKISKNGGAFADPNAGATNATEVSNGWYKVTLDTTDTGTLGDLVVRGTATSCDDAEQVCQVVKATNGGLTALPDAVAGANGGLPLSVDASGRVDVLKINGTSQTARDIGASVLLSAGTGTGQLDFTSGVIKANLAQILGTALTETAGQIAAGFKKFFNVAAPAMDVTSVNQTGDSYTRLGAPAGASVSADIAAVKSDTSGVKTKTDSLTFTVAGVVDSNVVDWKGATAPAMTGDAYARLGAPAGASVSADVAAVKVDTAATHTAVGTAGAGLTALGDTRIAHLDADISSRLAAGSYTAPPSAATIAQAVWDALTSALTTVGSIGKLLVTNVDATVSSRSSHSAADVWSVGTRVLTSGTNIALAKGTGVTGFNDLDASGVRGAVGMSSANLDTQLAAIDADVLTRSTYDGSDTAGTTTLLSRLTATRAGYLDNLSAGAVATASAVAALPQAVWDTLTTALTTVGSIGKLLVDNIDAAISSRLASGSYTAPDNAGIAAIETTLGTPAGASIAADIAAVPTASENASAVLAATYEGSETVQDHLRLARAALVGKANGLATTTAHYRDAADTKNRITATVDADGNRTAVTTDAT